MIYISYYMLMLLFRFFFPPRNINFPGALGLYSLVLLSTFVFIAFRYRVGCDFAGYEAHLERASSYGSADSSGTEPLYNLLIQIIIYFQLNVLILDVVSGAIYILGLNAVARRQPDPLLFVALTFPVLTINIGMSAVRQALALGILCFAFNAFIDRKRMRFLFFVLVASGFHTSSLIMAGFLPFIIAREVGWRSILSAGVLFVIGIVTSGSEAVSFYTERYVDTATNAAGAVFRTATYPAVGIYFLLTSKRWRVSYPKEFPFLLLSSLVMLTLPLVALYSSVIGDRVSYYFAVPQYIIAARAYLLSRSNNRQILLVVPPATLLVLLIGWILLSPLYPACYSVYQMWLG